MQVIDESLPPKSLSNALQIPGLVNVYSLRHWSHGPVEIVDLPWFSHKNHVMFHSYVNVYQRVFLPKKIYEVRTVLDVFPIGLLFGSPLVNPLGDLVKFQRIIMFPVPIIVFGRPPFSDNLWNNMIPIITIIFSNRLISICWLNPYHSYVLWVQSHLTHAMFGQPDHVL